jgi:ubiquinone biosynthesis protein
MEFVRGVKVTTLPAVRRIELDGDRLGDELFRAYLKQILVDGIFHADPHPGNVFLTDDDRVALIDLGMVGYVTEHAGATAQAAHRHQRREGRGGGGDRGVHGHALDTSTGSSTPGKSPSLVSLHGDSTMGEIDVGRVVVEITRISGENGVRQPAELTLLGKTLLNLDRVAVTLAPDFEVNDAIRRHAASLMRRRMVRQLSPTQALSAALEMNEFVQELPGRLNRMLDRVADNQVRIKVDAIDEGELITGIQKVANRITAGLILAALIVGAAMLMRVDTADPHPRLPGPRDPAVRRRGRGRRNAAHGLEELVGRRGPVVRQDGRAAGHVLHGVMPAVGPLPGDDGYALPLRDLLHRQLGNEQRCDDFPLEDTHAAGP